MKFVYEDKDIGVKGLSRLELEGNYPRWFLDRDVCAYNMHGIYPKSLESLRDYIDSLANSENSLVWAVYHKTDKRHIGNISLQIFNRIDNAAELAFLFGEKAYWGKGYAAVAAKFIFRHGFYVMNLHRIYCGTASSNKGMRRLAEKLGMREEGIRRESLFLNGIYEDEVLFGLLRQEFSQEE